MNYDNEFISPQDYFIHSRVCLAIAEVYLQEGNKEYREKELNNAIYFYTEGINVNCKDDALNAKLYSYRATAHFNLVFIY